MKNKPDTSHFDNLVKRVRALLEEDKPESEIFEAFKHEGMPKETIIHAICSADPNSPILDAYVSRVIIPNVNSLVEITPEGRSKYTMGEVTKILIKKYPELLVYRAIFKVIGNEYLVR